MFWGNFSVFSLVTKKNVKNGSKIVPVSNGHILECVFKKWKQLHFIRRRLSKLQEKDTILHATIIFFPNQGQTSKSWNIIWTYIFSTGEVSHPILEASSDWLIDWRWMQMHMQWKRIEVHIWDQCHVQG